MNYSLAAFLVSDDVRAVDCVYHTLCSYKKEENRTVTEEKDLPRYTFKTFDKSIEIGDLVFVPAGGRHGIVVVKVVDVDVEVDFDSKFNYKWIMGKVDDGPYKKVLEQEEAMIEQCKAAEKQHKKKELAEKLFEHMDPREAKKIKLIGNGS